MNKESTIGGKNKKRLIALFYSRLAIPPGGGLADGLAILTDPKRFKETTLQAIQLADQAITAMRAAPDNPYGDDEEQIAGGIVTEVEKKMNSRRTD